MEEENYHKHDEEYFKNLPLWPDAGVYDRTIDGVIPASRLESWEQFDDVVKFYSGDNGSSDYVFRGQHHYKWPLDPSLSRINGKPVDEEVAEKQLHNFRLSIRGRLIDHTMYGLSSLHENDSSDIELWAIGQHHGLATPFLDWSLSPYVALFFAFEQEDQAHWFDEDRNSTNFSRAIYVLNQTFIKDLEEPIENKYPRIVEPSKDDHGRLVNQAGLFTLAPYRETLESSLLKALSDSNVDIDTPEELAKYIRKIHIPNSEDFRLKCLRHLRRMNIHHSSLFPDLIGSSGYCNELTREFVYHRNQRKEFEKNKLEEKRVEAEKAEVLRQMDVIQAGVDEAFQNRLLWNDNSTIDALVNSMKSPEGLNRSEMLSGLSQLAFHLVDFINHKTGVDWFLRDSELARLRLYMKRRLSKIHFDENYIDSAAKLVVDKAAELAKEAEQQRLVHEYRADSNIHQKNDDAFGSHSTE